MLNQLGETGCLAVFIAALQDDCDIEVSKTAIGLTKHFVDMLKQYKITPEDLLTINLGSPRSVGSPQNSQLSSPNSNFSLQTAYSPSLLNNISPVSTPLQADGSQSDDSQYQSATPSSEFNMSPLAKQDAIIDEILDSQDLKLLESVFNTTDTPVNNSVAVKPRTVLNPKDFLDVVFGNYEYEANQKTQWIQDIENFNSLLNDILNEYEPSDVNTMDCY